MDRQRRELEALKGASRELLAASRTNKATQLAVHKAVLALLESLDRIDLLQPDTVSGAFDSLELQGRFQRVGER